MKRQIQKTVDELPDVYIIYITDFDMFQKKKAIYHVQRILKESKEAVYNGINEIYVNTVNYDGSKLADLMKLLNSSECEFDDRFPEICKTIMNFKIGKGRAVMCKVVEEYAQEYAQEKVIQIAKNMLKNGFSFESIFENTGLPMAKILQISEE